MDILVSEICEITFFLLENTVNFFVMSLTCMFVGSFWDDHGNITLELFMIAG